MLVDSVVDAISVLDRAVSDPSHGLPDEIFYCISRMTPLVNVDLIIKDENNRTLLSWRDDPYAGKGWHVPGGIIRFKEKIEDRIKKVAEAEIRSDIEVDLEPIALNQMINDEVDERGHFISILYRCHLASSFMPDNAGLADSDPGYLLWHDSCPSDLLKFHDIYREYI